MKIAPPSGDMLIKVALGLALFAGLGMVIWTIKSKASAAAGAVANAVDAVNPNSTDNLVYQAANGVYGTVLPGSASYGRNADGTFTLGGWIYDVTHPGTAANIAALTGGARVTQTDPIRYDNGQNANPDAYPIPISTI